jgi:acyl carrier protein
MDASIKNKIKYVMSSVFDIAQDEIQSDASAITIESWDSLKHMNLIVALEEEFETEFSDKEIIKMMSFNVIYEVVGNL